MTPRTALLLVISLGGLACVDDQGPNPLDATFALSRIDGSPPPVLIGATLNCDQFIDAGTLVFFVDGTLALSTQTTLDCTGNGGVVSHPTVLLSGSYTRSGGVITIRIDGSSPLAARYSGNTITGTLPASNATFPTPIDMTFDRVPAN